MQDFMQSGATSVYIIGTNVNGIRHRDGRNASRPPFYKSKRASVFVTTHSTSPHLHVHSLGHYMIREPAGARVPAYSLRMTRPVNDCVFPHLGEGGGGFPILRRKNGNVIWHTSKNKICAVAFRQRYRFPSEMLRRMVRWCAGRQQFGAGGDWQKRDAVCLHNNVQKTFVAIRMMEI